MLTNETVLYLDLQISGGFSLTCPCEDEHTDAGEKFHVAG